MRTKKFQIGVVLSIATGYLVAKDGFSDIHAICQFFVGKDALPDSATLRVADRRVRPQLLLQFPQLASKEMEQAIEDLGAKLATIGTGSAQATLDEWVQSIVEGKFGLNLPLRDVQMLEVSAP